MPGGILLDSDQGYWGRDHEGIPDDRQKKNCSRSISCRWEIDDNTFRAINGLTFGAAGAGITPIVLASTVDFWRAEAAFNNRTGDRSLMWVQK
jgi:hypothetical protein